MTGTDDPLPPDPWLREALRHAPDAADGPPAKLDDHILRMGRAAVAPRPAPTPPAPPSLGERLLSAWDWLARPPVAAGFASLLVATVVGVMWWDRPLQETLPPRESAPTATAEADAVPVPTPAPAPAVVSRGAPESPPAPAARPPEPKETARKAAAPEPLVPAAPPPGARPEPARELAADRASREKTEKAERTLDAEATNRSLLERRADAAAPAQPALSAAPPAASALGAAPSGLVGGLRARAAVGTIETPSLSNLRFEIKPRAQAWTWQRDGGAERPMDDAMQDWIALADRTARPHWNPGPAAGEGATTTLRFLRDGNLKATLRIGPKGLRLDRFGKTESAELSSAQTATLASALDALGP
ncbi:MAG: hypothetical protein KIT35_14980 [Piscinibacter sp.]|uniref:hypothetical protein n=1 Tax=Piscinibacter sp. TaxID=1903157 RepID=UPI00258ED274|nr:hypothetical protein [Piscinibacter sp.]MCW5665132.1 hypothetical protein [Piscinibacter sp.]